MKRFTPAALLLALWLFACSKSPEAVTVTDWEQFQEPYVTFSFKYPKGWVLGSEGLTISAFSTQEGAKKFLDPTSKAPDASQLVLSAATKKPLPTLSEFVDSVRADLREAGFRLDSVQSVTFGGNDGLQFSYSGSYGEGANLSATRFVTNRDSMFYSVLYAGFNDQYTVYRSVFDSVSASLQLPEPTAPVGDPSLPSMTPTTLKNEYIQISYPDNFEPSYPVPKGEVQYSLELRGYRQDCTMRLDILPSKGLTIDKVLEQNAKFYKGSSTGKATVDGLPSSYINYSPAKDIKSRVYFVVKGDKIYRVILNYWKPLENVYLPAFTGSVSSIKLP
jgi:hypothetical protein